MSIIKWSKKTIKTIFCWIYPHNSIFLHTNACGDFTLLSYEDWANLKGYPEWNIFSWHLDSVLLYQARQHGIKEQDLPISMPIYHIEHSSGYSPTSAQMLFHRLETQSVPYLKDSDLQRILLELNTSQQKMIYNPDDWGFGNLLFTEFIVPTTEKC